MAQELNGVQVEIENISGIAVGAALDGWDLTQGSKADATASASTLTSTPAAPYSVVALLKALVTGQSASSGSGGAATIASGSDATEGALGDAPLAAAASTSNSTVNAALKGIFNLLFNGTAKVALNAGSAIVGKLGIDQTTPGTTNGVVVNSSTLPTGAASAANQNVTAAGTSAASAQAFQGVTNGVPVPVTVAAGADATEGSTTDAPLAAAATTAGSTAMAVFKGLYNLFFNGQAKVTIQTALSRNTSAIPVLAATAIYTTATFDTGIASGSPSPYATYKIFVFPQYSGQIQFQGSNDNSSWVSTSGQIAVSGQSGTVVTSPIFFRYNRAIFTNGSTATTAAYPLYEQLTAV